MKARKLKFRNESIICDGTLCRIHPPNKYSLRILCPDACGAKSQITFEYFGRVCDLYCTLKVGHIGKHCACGYDTHNIKVWS